MIAKLVAKLCRPLVDRTLRDEDDAAERLRKKLLVPLNAIFIAITCWLMPYGSIKGAWAMVLFGVYFTTIEAGFIFCVLATKRLTSTAAGIYVLVLGFVASLVFDVVTFGTTDSYTLLVLMMDLLLFCGCHKYFALAVSTVGVVYLTIISVEQCIGLGIYTAVAEEWSQFDRPAPRGSEHLFLLTTVRNVAFLSDYFLTKYFKEGMANESEKMEIAVAVTQDVTDALSRFDLERAEELLGLNHRIVALPGELQGTLAKLIKNLHMYKPYLPHSCLPCETGGDMVQATSMMLCDKASERSTRSSYASCPALDPVSPAPASRTVSLVLVNVRGYLHTVEHYPTFLRTFQEKYLTTVVDTVRNYRGLTETFSGDRIVITFNAAKQCCNHRSEAARCSFSIQESRLAGRVSLSLAIASGKAYCGPLGCDGLRRYSVVGYVGSWAFILERLGARFGARILTDETVVEMATSLRFVLVDVVSFPKLGKKEVELYDILDHIPQTNEEWMYELDRHANDVVMRGNRVHREWIKGKKPHPDELADLEERHPRGPRLATMLRSPCPTSVKVVQDVTVAPSAHTASLSFHVWDLPTPTSDSNPLSTSIFSRSYPLSPYRSPRLHHFSSDYSVTSLDSPR